MGASLDVGNLGCCALAASFVQIFNAVQANSIFVFLYGNRTNGTCRLKVDNNKSILIDIVNFRMSPNSGPGKNIIYIFILSLIYKYLPFVFVRKFIAKNHCIKTILESDFIGEIRGGDSFSDIYGLAKFLIGILPILITLNLNKKLILLPQTYGPYKSNLSKRISKSIFNRAHTIISRDKDSIRLITEISDRKNSEKIKFCPDIAFMLRKDYSKVNSVNMLNKRNSKPIIGINISGLLYIGGFDKNNMFNLKSNYKNLCQKIIENFLKNTDCNILLIPHVYSHLIDRDEITVCKNICEKFSIKYGDRISYVNETCDQSEVKGIIGKCDFLMGARMHACIAALSQEVPAVGLAYSKKFHGVFSSLNFENNVIDLRTLTEDEILSNLMDKYEKRQEARDSLIVQLPKIKEQILTIFKDITK
jgi:polysaccharide pyruvyl transferase WcaK-like protein